MRKTGVPWMSDSLKDVTESEITGCQRTMRLTGWGFVWVLFISGTARERLVWNFPNFLSHSNFVPISVRDTRPDGRMARGRRPSIGCLVFERAANGARSGLGHNRGCLQSCRLHINTWTSDYHPGRKQALSWLDRACWSQSGEKHEQRRDIWDSAHCMTAILIVYFTMYFHNIYCIAVNVQHKLYLLI